MTPVVSVIIPANNEGRYIGACLKALLSSDPLPGHVMEVLVVANGCSDDTVPVASRFKAMAEPRGWRLRVLELTQGSKIAALNEGDARALGRIRVYLDADVVVDPELLPALTEVLATRRPRYATGTARIAPPQSLVTRLYARFWQSLPYTQINAPGFGLFALNAEARIRWAEWPDLIADDMFARLNFVPEERVQVPQGYQWPMAEGLSRLIRVRRRQDRGMAQLSKLFPVLMLNEAKPEPDLPTLMRADPLGFAVYGAVAVAVRLTRFLDAQGWARGR